MTEEDWPVPNAISNEAKQFYESATPLERWTLADGAVDRLRAEEQAEAGPINERIIQSYVERLDDEEIVGIPVQIVTPAGYESRNDGCGILYFFGGAYVVGSPLIDLAITARLSYRLGIKVYAPYYRRAPEYPYPAAVDDGFVVYQSLCESLSSGGIGLAGESAGGNLALAVALRASDQGLPPPAAVALMSPWCDLTPVGESQQQPTGFDPTLDYALHLQEAAAAYAGNLGQQDPRISPLYADYKKGFPPTLITTGTRELFLSDCVRLSTSMRKAGVDVRLRIWEGMWHVFEWYHEIPEAEQSMDEIAAFLTEHLEH